jgi:hypothetical protein
VGIWGVVLEGGRKQRRDDTVRRGGFIPPYNEEWREMVGGFDKQDRGEAGGEGGAVEGQG